MVKILFPLFYFFILKKKKIKINFLNKKSEKLLKGSYTYSLNRINL